MSLGTIFSVRLLRHPLVMPGIAIAGVAAVVSLAAGRDPTEFEQYFVELINRARANPDAEVARLSGEVWGDIPFSPPATPDRNEGLPTGFLSNAARQPLAINTTVTGVSSTYTTTLIDNDALGHFVSGSVSSRLSDGGYGLNPTPAGAAETIGAAVDANAFPISVEVIDQQFQEWFINNNVSLRLDRLTLLDGSYKEVGAAIGTSDDYTFFGASTPNAVVSVINYTYREDDPFITGVAFTDLDGDNFYTPGIGEALGGIQIDVYDAESKLLVTSGQTFASGGYSFQLPDGFYDLVVHDPVAGDVFFHDIELAGQNFKQDYIAVPEPTALIWFMFALLGFGLNRSRR